MDQSDAFTRLHLVLPAMWCTTHRQILLNRISTIQGVQLLQASEETLNIECCNPLSRESAFALQDIFSYWQFDRQAYAQLETLKLKALG